MPQGSSFEWCVVATNREGVLAMEFFEDEGLARRKFLDLIAAHGGDGRTVRMLRTINAWRDYDAATINN